MKGMPGEWIQKKNVDQKEWQNGECDYDRSMILTQLMWGNFIFLSEDAEQLLYFNKRQNELIKVHRRVMSGNIKI